MFFIGFIVIDSGNAGYTTVRKICEKDLTRLPVGNNTTYINEQIHDLARDLTEYTALVDLGELQ